MPSGEPAAFFV